MKNDIIEIYQAILNPQGIHTLFLQPPYTYIKDADYSFREHIFENYDYNNLFVVLEKVTNDIPVLIYKDDFMVEYCLLLFPKKLQKKYNATHLLIGPVVFQPVTSFEVSQLLEKKKLPSSLYNDFMEFYNHIPSLPSRDFWISLLQPLLHEI